MRIWGLTAPAPRAKSLLDASVLNAADFLAGKEVGKFAGPQQVGIYFSNGMTHVAGTNRAE